MKEAIIALLFIICSQHCFCQIIYPVWFIPVVVNSPGVNNSHWRSDLYITNLEEEDIVIDLTFYINDGREYKNRINLSKKGNIIIEDVVHSLFNIENIYGILMIEAFRESDLKLAKVIVSSKAYTNKNGESYGQSIYPITPASENFVQIINGIINDEEFRTNIGVFCVFGGATLLISYFNKDGYIEQEEYITLYNSGTIQKKIPVNGKNYYAKVRYINGNGLCGSYISQVNNKTNDGVFIPCFFLKED